MALTPYDLEQDLANAIRALNNARSALARSTDPADRAKLEQFIRETEEYIRQLNAQLAAQRTQSVGETVKEDQAANAEGADTQSPSLPPQVQNPDGTVTPAPRTEPSTADTVTTSPDSGLDAPKRSNSRVQTDRSLPFPGPVTPNSGRGDPGGNAATVAASAGDDKTGDNSTRALLREIFGNTGQLSASPNVLDRFASYTYTISIYLMSPSRYRYQLLTKKKNLAGYSLLMQSGGAPQVNPNPVPVDPQEIEQDQDGISSTGAAYRNLGRNPYFKLDYYIDDVRLKSIVQGRGSRTAHNVFELTFKITEPNGITLIDNLYKAVQDYLTQTGDIDGRTPVNYAAQNYLMVIRFYGYDQYGNLIPPQRKTGDTSDSNAAIEKWIPFQFTGIKFRVTNQLVEYECSAVGIQNLASSQQRNTIPYNVEITASTVGELLNGSATFTGGPQVAGNPQVQEGVTASGLPREARGVAAPVNPADQVTAITRNGVAQTAPPKANTAPKTNTPKTVVRGLIDALNKYQEEYAKERRYEVADQYDIVFKVPKMAEAELLPAGPVDKKKPPMIQTTNPQQAKDGARQSNDFTSQNKSILAGTTIIQFLDQVLRNSKYITDQQTQKWNDKKKEYEINGQAIPETAWYTITMQAEPLAYDNIRGDYAYKFTYQISPYLVTDLKSQYFQPSRPWTPPKKYNYWFTGQNTAILNFTQEYNYLYYTVLSGPNAPTKSLYSDYRTIDKSAPQTRSNESDAGQSGPIFEAPANAADSLYSPSDTIRSKLTIIGDPDWIQQGDLWSGISGAIGSGPNADFDTVLPDGSLNYETREPIYEILFNKPVDYDLNTGLMDPTKKNVTVTGADGKKVSEAQISYVYRAFMVESYFSKGQFIQDIEGAQVFFRKPSTDTEARPAPSAAVVGTGAGTGTPASVVRVPPTDAPRNVNAATDWFKDYQSQSSTAARPDSLSARLAGQSTNVGFVATLPASAAAAPTSGSQTIGTTLPLFDPPSTAGSSPTLGVVQSLSPTQQQIIELQSQIDRAASRGDLASVAQLGRQLQQLQAQLSREAPPAPITRTQSIVKD